MNQHSEFNYDGVTKTALDKLFDNPFEDTEVNELYKTRDDFCKIPNISDFADSRALSRAALLAKNRELLTTPNRDYPNPKASRTNPNGDGAGAESSVALDGNDTGLLHKGVGVSQTEVRSSKADNKSLKGDLDENYQREAQNNDIVEKPASGTSSVVEGRREDVRLRRSGGTTSDNDKVDRKHNDAASPLGLSEDDRRLTKYENEALDLEQQGSLKSLTSGQLLLLLLCACGAMAQGWAQESIVGANLTWPVDMGLAEFDDSRRLQWLENGLVRFAWVNAAPYLAGSLIGAWISDPISYARGRRLTLLVAGLCSFVAPIGCAYSNYWYQLLIWRIFLGIGIGVKSSVVPVLEAEAFTPQLRGKLLVSWQGFVAAGIFLASGTNQLFRGQWRLQIGIPFIAAIPILCLSYAVPESPRWLIKRGRMVNGLKALRRLRQTPLQADRDLLIIDAQINLERRFYVNKRARRTKDSPSGDLESLEAGERDKTTDLSEVRKYFERIPRLFTIARCRRAVFASCAVMFSQPASGINLFAFLAPTLIKQSGIDDPSNVETLWFNFGFGAVNAIFSLLAFFLFERWGRREQRFGRRTLLLSSQIAMVLFLPLIGHYIDAEIPDLKRLIPLVLLYTAVYSPGAGVMPFLYGSEVFPQDYREPGMSFACSFNLMCNFILAITVPLFTESPKDSIHLPKGRYSKVFNSFAGINVLSIILNWVFMRSPEQFANLARFNVLFDSPWTTFVRYQFCEASWWAVKRIIRPWKDSGKLAYHEWQDRLDGR